MSEPDFKRTKYAKLAEVRVALRAAERAAWVNHVYEVDKLKEQVDTIYNDPDVRTHEEVDQIIQQLNQKTAKDLRAATYKANATETFSCGICLSTQKLGELRLIVPCGHGFCDKCTAKLQENITRAHAHEEKDIPGCPNCRKKIDSVLKAYV
jgi:hypothetical protein